MTVKQRVLAFIRENSLLGDSRKVLVAVSGGPDSVCLLHVLHELQYELGITLHAAHLNHGLRAGESDADAAWVEDFSRSLDIPCTVASRDVSAYRRRNRVSLEEAAREVRYSFLAEVAGWVGAGCVAVGHTADDNAETVLMHLIRGSGTRGLRGLQPVTGLTSGNENLLIIRPLLGLHREETVAYCREHEIIPRLDSSNLSVEPFRNRIRHRLIPQLSKYNPRIIEAILRTARIAADDSEFIESELTRLLPDITRSQGDSIIIDKTSFAALPHALKRYLLRDCIEKLLGSLKDIEAGHIEDIIAALDKPAGKVIGLPQGLNFTIEYNRYVLGPDSAALSPLPPPVTPAGLNIPGKTSVPGWLIESSVVTPADVETEKGDEYSAFFDFHKTGTELTVRCRLPGDRFQPLGMTQTKKLNEYMIDARIPRSWRRRVPLVVSPEQIIWVVGWRTDERVRVTGSTGEVLRMRFSRA